jgi:hypothetical protein
MGRVLAWTLWALLFASAQAAADLKVMVAVDPSDRESIVISVIDLQATLSRVTGQSVSAIRSEDLGDVMRSTRAGEYDVYIASALHNRYEEPQVAVVVVSPAGIAQTGLLQDAL